MNDLIKQDILSDGELIDDEEGQAQFNKDNTCHTHEHNEADPENDFSNMHVNPLVAELLKSLWDISLRRF